LISPKATNGIVVKNIYQESFAFFSADKVALPRTQEWLKQKSLIVFGQAIATPRKTIVEVLEQLDLGDCIRHDLSSFDAVLSFARKDLGVALAPLVLTENIIRPTDVQRVRIKGVNEKEFGTQQVGIVCSRHYVADPKVVAFSQSLLHLGEL
jgi:DNA-binding transcriptional LysR family regulator